MHLSNKRYSLTRPHYVWYAAISSKMLCKVIVKIFKSWYSQKMRIFHPIFLGAE